MDFRELLQKRRSIRNYEARPVPMEIIKDIISESIMAPNARNAQPWAFIVVTNSEVIQKLSDESKQNILKELEENPVSTLMNYKEILKDPRFNVFYNAPCVVYIAGLNDVRTSTVDCTLAASYFMLSAVNRGLGTCWIDLGSAIRDPKMKREIGLVDEYRIIATLALGFPDQSQAAAMRNIPKILKVVE